MEKAVPVLSSVHFKDSFFFFSLQMKVIHGLMFASWELQFAITCFQVLELLVNIRRISLIM